MRCILVWHLLVDSPLQFVHQYIAIWVSKLASLAVLVRKMAADAQVEV